jgi:hypothetical protein
MASAFAQLLTALLSFWSGPDTVGALDAPGGLVSTLTHYTSALLAAAATLGVIVAGTRLAITSSRIQEPARDLARGLLVLALVAGGGAVVVQAVRSVLDDAADGLLTQGFDGAPVGSQLVALTDLQRGGLSPGVTFLLGLLGSLSTFAQFFVMVVRGPVLALLVGLAPIAAATTMMGTGISQLRRVVAWAGALTAYKFVAGLLYAAAFLAVSGSRAAGDGLAAGSADPGRVTGAVTGIALIIVAVGVLPALVRVLTPTLEAAFSGGTATGEVSGPAPSGALLLSGRGVQSPASGPPSDAGAQAGAGLVRTAPTGTALAGATRGRPAAIGGRAPIDAAPIDAAPIDAAPTDAGTADAGTAAAADRVAGTIPGEGW